MEIDKLIEPTITTKMAAITLKISNEVRENPTTRIGGNRKRLRKNLTTLKRKTSKRTMRNNYQRSNLGLFNKSNTTANRIFQS